MGQRIMVVDDDELICDLVRETLSFEGYEIDAAYSGEQALARLAQVPADLVLLDIMMAGIDGIEVSRRMLNDARLCTIPVIFLTAKDQFTDQLRGEDPSALDFITKPFHPLSLAPIIHDKLLAAHNRLDEGQRYSRLMRLQGLSPAAHFAPGGISEQSFTGH